MEPLECQICCEKFNKSTHYKVTCNYCEYSNCRSCFQKYLVDTTLDPHCMNCKKFFQHEFLSDNCTCLFINKTLKQHRENMLFEREKALLPSTQNDVLFEKEKRFVNTQIRQNFNETKELKSLIRVLKSEKSNETNELKSRITKLRHENLNLHNTLLNFQTINSDVKQFIRKCPVIDCRGFLSTKWKCGTCETKICKKCNEPKLEEHVCDPENVTSMELINKDTKPCPKCGTMIHKISGCSQIWCVDCHTAWDWNTSRIEVGRVHNPHYYDFMRKQNYGIIPRNPGDIPGDNPCGGVMPGYYNIQQSFRNKKFKFEEPVILLISNIHRTAMHIQHVEIRQCNNHIHPVGHGENYKKERVLYLLNELSEQNFKKILQQREKRNDKLKEFLQVYQMFVEVCNDTLSKIYEAMNSDEVIVHTQVFHPLTKYFNESLCGIAKRYKCVYPGITNYYNFIHNYEKYLKTLKD